MTRIDCSVWFLRLRLAPLSADDASSLGSGLWWGWNPWQRRGIGGIGASIKQTFKVRSST